VQIPGVAKSRLNTPVDYSNWGNPQWNFEGKQVWGWTPGKSLLFEVKNKGVKDSDCLGTTLGCSEDHIMGGVTLTPEQYLPNGFNGWLELHDGYGNMTGELLVAVEAFGIAQQRDWLCGLGAAGGACSRSCAAVFANIPKHLEEVGNDLLYLLGPPYPNRDPKEKYKLIFIPFIIFFVIVWMLCLLRHVSPTLVSAITGTIAIVSICIAIWGVIGRSGVAKGISFSAIGCLCLLAVFLGIWAGNYGWWFSWRQWWWMRTGQPYGGNMPGTPAAARVDASSVSFANTSTLVSVDATRASGFRRGDIYCAAPILDPDATNAETIRVNYWAIGINCCDDFGSFTCDAAREGGGNIGVVMLNKGLPGDGEHANYFRWAAEKSAGAYKMVSAPAALYVRYVKDRGVVNTEYTLRGIWVLLETGMLGLLFFYALGWLVDYKGWGKPPRVQVRELTSGSVAKINKQNGCCGGGQAIDVEKVTKRCKSMTSQEFLDVKKRHGGNLSNLGSQAEQWIRQSGPAGDNIVGNLRAASRNEDEYYVWLLRAKVEIMNETMNQKSKVPRIC
jgi:uncharacterized protein (DUF2237 family)